MDDETLLSMGLAERREFYILFARAYILNRWHTHAQDSDLAVLSHLAKVWGLSGDVQDAWHKTAAARIETTRAYIEHVQRESKYRT